MSTRAYLLTLLLVSCGRSNVDESDFNDDPTVLGCRTGEVACDGVCVRLESDVSHCGACANACPATQVCSVGRCTGTCARDLTNCSGSCVDLSTSPRNCGACGHACSPGVECRASACVTTSTATCPSSLELCSGVCTDLKFDPQNCGACGNRCRSGGSCRGGRCR